MLLDDKKIDSVYDFLSSNTGWNEAFQSAGYLRILSHCENNSQKVHELLRGTVNTQSQPKMGSLGPFWRVQYEFECKGKAGMDTFTRHLVARGDKVSKGTGPWENLYQALRRHAGWGEKTAALFVKNVIRIHRGPKHYHFWEDATSLANPPIAADKIYLPVDKVIEVIFAKLGMQRANFKNINKYLHQRFSPEDMLVWDDLWFWGFFTQMIRSESEESSLPSREKSRVFEWNSDKYWCQIDTQKDQEDTIRALASKFISLLN